MGGSPRSIYGMWRIYKNGTGELTEAINWVYAFPVISAVPSFLWLLEWNSTNLWFYKSYFLWECRQGHTSGMAIVWILKKNKPNILEHCCPGKICSWWRLRGREKNCRSKLWQRSWKKGEGEFLKICLCILVILKMIRHERTADLTKCGRGASRRPAGSNSPLIQVRQQSKLTL